MMVSLSRVYRQILGLVLLGIIVSQLILRDMINLLDLAKEILDMLITLLTQGSLKKSYISKQV